MKRAAALQRSPWAAGGVMLALGAVQTPAFAHPAAWWLPLLCIAALALAVADAAPRRAAWLGWCFGSGWLGAGTWWLYISLHRYGGLAAPLAVLAVALLAVALSLYLALAMALFARWRCGRIWIDAPLFAAVWVLAELARTVIFTGFPWLASGYSQVAAPLAGFAPLIGVTGIGALCALIGALLAFAISHRTKAALGALTALALVLLAGATLRGVDYSRDGGRLSVTLLQTDVAQDQKFAAEQMPAALAWLARSLDRASGDLVVAPETAIPLLPDQLGEMAPSYWPALRERFEDSRQAALIGVPLGDLEQGYTNSVYGVSAATRGHAPYRYDKVHLVPFGEFVPSGFRWFVDLMNIPLGDFVRGPLNAPSFVFDGQRIAPNICYEDLFGVELALRFADAATAPTIFANVSNIGWFGDTSAIGQHLQISRMRSLEFQRPMLRATNTGATAIIDYRGRVSAMMPPFRRGVLDGEVDGRNGITPFAWWASRFAHWPWLALAAVLFVLAASKQAADKRFTRS